MNPRDTALLKSILAKNPVDLLPSELIFLKARTFYLNDNQLKRYAGIIKTVKLESQPETLKPLLTYNELLVKARSVGYTGNRPKREILEAYIRQYKV